MGVPGPVWVTRSFCSFLNIARLLSDQSPGPLPLALLVHFPRGRIDADLPVDHARVPHAQRLGARRRRGQAGLDVELSLVERAFDLAALDEALGQRARPVRTLILRHIVVAIDDE